VFVPIEGAWGYQVGNPAAVAIVSVLASLDVFHQTSMAEIRKKSLSLTGFLEDLLNQAAKDNSPSLYSIITPSDPKQRGAQLSVLLKDGLLEGVMAELEDAGVVLDERKPNVIRIAPAPLYNTYTEVYDFVEIFRNACEKVNAGKGHARGEVGKAKQETSV
jgi:kynureninase